MTDLKNVSFKYKFNLFRILLSLIVYGIFGVFSFLYFRSYLALLFLIVIALLVISSLVSLYIISKNISFDIYVSDEYIYKGENIGLGICIHNRSIFSSLKCICEFYMNNDFIGSKDKCNMILPVIPINKKTYNYSFVTSEIGNIEIRVNLFEVYDLFGIAKTVFEVDEYAQICVLPARENISDDDKAAALDNLLENDNENMKGTESSDSFDVRDYIPGDRIKDIHWKLSVKKDDLLVKERLKISDSKIIIWIDSSNSRKIRENILSLAYGLIWDFVSEGIINDIYWYDYKKNIIKTANVSKENEIRTFIKDLYYSGYGESIDHPETLLLLNGLKASSIIRVCLQDYEVKILTYDI